MIGRRLGIRRLPRLGEEDDSAFFPQTGDILEVETRPINDAQDSQHIGGGGK